MTTIINSFKGFDKDLKCRDFQFEVGKEYEEPKAEACECGFHACENPLDVLEYYGGVDNRFCEVEQSGEISRKSDDTKVASSKIKIKAEIGFTGLFKAGIEYLKQITSPQKVIDETKEKGEGGNYAKIGSSGDSAQIGSTGKDCVICCAGRNGTVKANVGSWITLAEWTYSDEKKRYIPKCVKTKFVDGEIIKADTWYMLVDGEFKEVNT